MRDLILNKIRELSKVNGGQPPGSQAFARQTGITEGKWRGVFWARWGDALTEAGFRPNDRQRRFENSEILAKIAAACRHYERLPTSAEMKLHRLRDPSFPSYRGIERHFGNRVTLTAALNAWCKANVGNDDVTAMLPKIPEGPQQSIRSGKLATGSVYLIKSGAHYKIGRSDEIERRIKEIRTALPEAAVLVHTIQTDDPAGIEAYWHRRFADRRANGEWFRLESGDVTAFKKRKFQ